MNILLWLLGCILRPFIRLQVFMLRSINDRESLELLYEAWKDAMKTYETKYKGD